MFKIKLDPGHGAGRAHNRGGVCYNEGDNNYYYSLVLKKELERIPGVFVSLTRNRVTDNPSLPSRAASGAGYDLFLSLHSNAFNGKATGSVILDNVARPNKALATKLVRDIANAFGHNNRGVSYKKNSSGGNYFGVLRNNRAKSSMIIEHGFHDNAKDCNFFKNNHLKLAQITANIVRQHYKLGTPINTVIWYAKDKKDNDRNGVIKLQRDLEYLGYPVGEYGCNGIFGDDTEKAVKDFQVANGLKDDGSAGPDTLKMIAKKKKEKESLPSRNYVRQGDKGDRIIDIKQLQKDLILLGYGDNLKEPNGDFGSLTHKAVMRLQNEHMDKANGAVGPATQRVIDRLKKELEEKENQELYKVQVGAYAKKDNAKNKLNELKEKGEDGYIKKE